MFLCARVADARPSARPLRRISLAKFERFLSHQRIAWPRNQNGRLLLDEQTFRQQAKTFPALEPLRSLRRDLAGLRLERLAVGHDSRNRTLLSPFASKTGRNQPSNSKFIFGLGAWLRSLIKPPRGRALAYIDYRQQEIAIAGALSGDARLCSAYQSGDAYLGFARLAGVVPEGATAASHPEERALYKQCLLATQYAMSEYGLAAKLGKSLAFARWLLDQHHRQFPQFWRWVQQQLDTATLSRQLRTGLGWKIRVTDKFNTRSLQNFPVQSTGAAILQIACCEATERGIAVCAPIHDALLIEAGVGEIDEVVADTQQIMQRAGEVLLGGFQLGSDAKIVRFPDRFVDEERGLQMWRQVHAVLGRLDTRPSTD